LFEITRAFADDLVDEVGQMPPNPIMKPLRNEGEMPLLSRCELQQRVRVHRFYNRLGHLTDVRTITFGIL
jgi:hypothetical protein